MSANAVALVALTTRNTGDEIDTTRNAGSAVAVSVGLVSVSLVHKNIVAWVTDNPQPLSHDVRQENKLLVSNFAQASYPKVT